jgi:hypothetical protein
MSGSPGTPETDQILMAFAQRAGDLDSLLTSFFGFLHRKTDLYIEQRGDAFAMGFRAGEAEAKVLQAFRQFPTKPGHALRVKPGSGNTGNTGNGNGRAARNESAARQLVEVEEITEPPPSSSSSSASPSSSSASSSSAAASAASTTAPSVGPLAPSAKSSQPVPPTIRLTKEGKQIPVGNGGVTERYHWTQTLREVTVYVAVPPGTRGKDLVFEIKPRRMRLALKETKKKDGTAGDDSNDILTGDLGGTVRHHEAVWTLEDRTTVILTLEKAAETWWSSVIKGDAQIDTTKVDSTRSVSDYDPETQGHIRKIMFDQRQKAQGLPTSEEQKTHDLLEKAKHLPGSPFSQEYLASAVGQPGSGGPQMK